MHSWYVKGSSRWPFSFIRSRAPGIHGRSGVSSFQMCTCESTMNIPNLPNDVISCCGYLNIPRRCANDRCRQSTGAGSSIVRLCSGCAAFSDLGVTDHVRKGRLAGRVEIDLKRVQAERQHGKITEAADDVDDAVAAEEAERRGESRVADEVLLEHLGAELIKHPLIFGRELGCTLLGDRLQGLRLHAGGDGLV